MRLYRDVEKQLANSNWQLATAQQIPTGMADPPDKS
jgi:hypothetical protein